MSVNLKLKDQKGFLLIEIILAIAIFAMLSFVALSAFIYGRDATVVSGNNMIASEIVNESIEAVHNISDSNYLNLSNYTNGTTYYLQQVGTQWSLSSSPTLINGIYTPAVVFTAGPISDSRQVTVTVTWKEDITRNGSLSATTYMSNWSAGTSNPVQTRTGLLVYANGGDTKELIEYQLLQSTGTWTNPSPLPAFDPKTDNEVAESVKLYPAQTGDDKVMIARLYDSSKQYLYGMVWNGTSWGNVQLLTSWSSSGFDASGNFSGSYMANGTFVAVYDDDTNTPKYNTWNGTAWSTQGALPAISSDKSDYPESMIVEARPGANEAMVVMLGADNETVASFYNGTSWSANTTLAASGTSGSTKNVDFAWSPVNSLQGAAVFTNSATDQSLQFSIFTDNGKGSGSWGSTISTTAQPSGSQSVTNSIIAQPLASEEWIGCDKDNLSTQHIYCYTLKPSGVTNPTNQTVASNGNDGEQQSADLGYGLLSGTTGLIAYSNDTSSTQLKTFNSSTNTWESTALAAPNASTTIYKTHIIPEPGSNDAMVLMIDGNDNLYSIMYNATNNTYYTTPTDFAWTIHNADGPSIDSKWFDFAWDQ
jgi:competence protein ComGC